MFRCFDAYSANFAKSPITKCRFFELDVYTGRARIHGSDQGTDIYVQINGFMQIQMCMNTYLFNYGST